MKKYFLLRSRCVFGQFSLEDLDIFKCALENNSNFGVSGFLYRTKTHYFQCLEGKDGVIDQLLNNLERDRRHYEIQLLASGVLTFPKFSGWSMGYARYSRAKPEQRIAMDDSPSSVIRKLQREAVGQLTDFVRPALKDRDNQYAQPPEEMLLLRKRRLTSSTRHWSEYQH